MTIVLANLYGLRKIDESDPRWSSFNYYQETSGSAAAEVVSALVQPPLDKLWFLTHVYGLATGAAGVAAVAIRFYAAEVRQGATLYVVHGERFNPGLGAGATGITSQKVDTVLIGGAVGIRATFGFDAGNAANLQHWSLYGYEVPKGNILI